MPVDARTIRDRENGIFARWESECPEICERLVYDGVSDPDAFFAAPARVLFILKEPYSDGAGWDFRETFHTHLKGGKTWNNASRWVQAAIDWRTPRPWSEATVQTQETRRAAMTSAAFINLKKTPGGARSFRHEISDFVQKYRKYLLDQISLYQPEITILGGTAEWLGDLFGDQQGPREKTDSGLVYRKIGPLGYAVRMTHPQASRSAKKSYETLVNGLTEMLS